MKKVILTDKGNYIFIDGPMANSTSLTIIGEKNEKEFKVDNLSNKQFDELRKEKNKNKIKNKLST